MAARTLCVFRSAGRYAWVSGPNGGNMDTMTIPTATKAEIARRAKARAGSDGGVVLPEDRERFIEGVEPRFRVEAEQVFEDAVMRDNISREERRDRQLNELVAMVSNITRLVSARNQTSVLNVASEAAEPDHMITVRDVAGALGVCVRTVHRLTAAGELPPPAKIGRTSRWSAGDVSAYLRKVRSTRPDFTASSLSKASA